MSNTLPALKKNDLYIYDLPEQIINSLELMVFDSSVKEVILEVPKEAPEPVKKAVESNSLECGSCERSFESQEDRKEHYKSDFHRFNIKRKLANLPPIDIDEFEKLTENEDLESISGSDSEESDDGEENIYKERKDELTTIFETQLANMNLEEKETESKFSHLNTQSPHIFFKSSLLPEGQVFAVYKALFSKDSIERPLETIREWNSKTSSESCSALFMIGGGHFAGAIVSHQRLNTKGNSVKQQSLQEQGVQLLEHKTFHRYTTRRKQGGSQSAMDNAKGKANSAGSSLRRYNEKALKVDVQSLLTQWEPFLKRCDNIFIRARSSSDRAVFFDDNTCIKTDDPRIRSFPFTTKRPTASELKKAWCQLTYLSQSSRPETIPKQNSAVESKNQNAKEATKKPAEREKTTEEKQTLELVALLKKSKAPLLVSFIRKNNLNINFKLQPYDEYIQTPTLLHLASQQGLKNMVLILLSNLKSDPTITNHFGKTAWDLAKKSEVRHAFQIARYNLGEGFTDWTAAHVEEPLSREQVNDINQKVQEKEESERIVSISKELEAAKQRQKLEKEKKRGPGVALGSQLSNLQQTMNSLNDDQKMRFMREQRARAAEARMRMNATK